MERKQLNSANDEKIKFNSVFRAAQILICLSEGINTVADIANDCGLSMSTVHRLLKTLEKTGFVIYTPIGHRYYLGPLVCHLTSNPQTTHQSLIMCASDEMNRLSKVSEETITLEIAIGIEVITLYQLQSSHTLKVTEDLKLKTRLLPIGSVGKALLSYYDEKELTSIIKTLTWDSLVNKFSFNKESLVTELKRIKKQGYAISHGERIMGALGISAIITNYLYPASLSITGYDNRLLPKVSILIEELKASAIRVSKNLAELI